MRNRQVGSRWSRFLRSPLVALGLVLVALWFLRSVWTIYPRANLAGALARQATDKLLATKERQQELAAEAAALKTERGVEASIRGKFSVVKEDERVITVVSSPTATATSTKSWWSWFVLWISNIHKRGGVV